MTPSQTEQYTRALRLTKPVSRRRLYCTTRAIFVTGFQQVSRSTASSPRCSGRARRSNVDDFDVQLEDEAVEQVDSETPEDIDQNIMEREGGQDAMR